MGYGSNRSGRSNAPPGKLGSKKSRETVNDETKTSRLALLIVVALLPRYGLLAAPQQGCTNYGCGEEDMELFHIAGSSGVQEVRVSFVSSKLNSLKATQKLYSLPWYSKNSFMLDLWQTGTRGFRFRGLKQGDVRMFITQVMPQPGYWKYDDITSLQFTLGRNPLALLSQAHSRELTTNGRRLHNLGKLSAAETAEAFEIVHACSTNSPGFFINHQGKMLPTDYRSILDAVITNERLTVIASKAEHSVKAGTKRIEYQTTFSLLTLDQKALQPAGK